MGEALSEFEALFFSVFGWLSVCVLSSLTPVIGVTLMLLALRSRRSENKIGRLALVILQRLWPDTFEVVSSSASVVRVRLVLSVFRRLC